MIISIFLLGQLNHIGRLCPHLGVRTVLDTAFNLDVFRCARESASLALEDAARAIGIVSASLLAMERGEKAPSRTTLSKMAKAYHRSLLTFYLPAPPRQGDRGEDFRTVGADRTTAANAEVDALVHIPLTSRDRLDSGWERHGT